MVCFCIQDSSGAIYVAVVNSKVGVLYQQGRVVCRYLLIIECADIVSKNLIVLHYIVYNIHCSAEHIIAIATVPQNVVVSSQIVFPFQIERLPGI